MKLDNPQFPTQTSQKMVINNYVDDNENYELGDILSTLPILTYLILSETQQKNKLRNGVSKNLSQAAKQQIQHFKPSRLVLCLWPLITVLHCYARIILILPTFIQKFKSIIPQSFLRVGILYIFIALRNALRL